MNVNGITEVSTSYASYDAPVSKTETQAASQQAAENTSGVVYEKSAETNTAKTQKKDNSAIIAQLKADADARTQQLQSIVQQLMCKQGNAYGQANDMWKFLASGNFTVDPATKAQAQADIAEDGYWGVEQTSERILSFAKALSGSDPEKADEMLAAFKKGFDQAKETWGGELPEISQRTYDAVIEKFNAWKAEVENPATAG